MAFGKSNLVKSGYTFGLAAVFLSIACFTTTWGIFIKLGISLNTVPWHLLLISINVASLENVFLLTNAVLYAGCDMIVIEKVSRGKKYKMHMLFHKTKKKNRVTKCWRTNDSNIGC